MGMSYLCCVLVAISACLAQALAGPNVYDQKNKDVQTAGPQQPGDNQRNANEWQNFGGSNGSDGQGHKHGSDGNSTSILSGSSGSFQVQTRIVTTTIHDIQTRIAVQTMMVPTTVTVTAIQPCTISAVTVSPAQTSPPPESAVSTLVLTLASSQSAGCGSVRLFTTTDCNFKPGLASIPIDVANAVGVQSVNVPAVSPGGFYSSAVPTGASLSGGVDFAGTTFTQVASGVSLGLTVIPSASVVAARLR